MLDFRCRAYADAVIEHLFVFSSLERNIMAIAYDPAVTSTIWVLFLASLGGFWIYVPTMRFASVFASRSECEEKTDPEFDWDECRDANFSLREWVQPYITLHNVLIVFHPLCVWFMAACVARSMQVGYWFPLVLAAGATVYCAVSFSKNKPLACKYMTGIAALEILFIPYIWLRQQASFTQALVVGGVFLLGIYSLAALHSTKR